MRLARDRARQQRLAGSRRAREQHSVGHPAAEPAVAGRVAQEVDDLGQLGLGLVDPGDVLERDPDRRPGRSGVPSSVQSCRARPFRRRPSRRAA